MEKKGHVLNFISILMMAIGPLLAKFGVLEISPAKAAIINVLVIIAASYLFGLMQRKKVTFYKDKAMIVLGVLNSLGVILMYISTNLLSPVEIGFIGRFYTVFAILLSLLLLKERLSKNETIFILFAMVGIFLFIDTGNVYGASLIGSVCALLQTFCFALSNVFIKRATAADKDSNSILFTNNCIALIFVTIYAISTGQLFEGGYPVSGIGLIALSSLLTGFVGTLFLYEALKYLRFSIANTVRAFSPILLAAISFPFFPVEITWQKVTGAVIVLFSILLLTKRKKQGSVSRKAG
ncbi:DMT family transporter [Terribacillus sp. DMT04]|uniref:DMT family transporter n=1 Tax=Terribacillus sp. DMT04 TaxID=2850441 RepID=UPI001C2C88D0|nr:DMT family transporter [Terribacillus sp. DMT04]QXE01999.1 DMT family transporter [Terribacillus sp. DMT04]